MVLLPEPETNGLKNPLGAKKILTYECVSVCYPTNSYCFHMTIAVFGFVVSPFGLILYIPVNSFGHVRTVSSPNHTFLLGKLH